MGVYMWEGLEWACTCGRGWSGRAHVGGAGVGVHMGGAGVGVHMWEGLEWACTCRRGWSGRAYGRGWSGRAHVGGAGVGVHIGGAGVGVHMWEGLEWACTCRRGWSGRAYGRGWSGRAHVGGAGVGVHIGGAGVGVHIGGAGVGVHMWEGLEWACTCGRGWGGRAHVGGAGHRLFFAVSSQYYSKASFNTSIPVISSIPVGTPGPTLVATVLFYVNNDQFGGTRYSNGYSSPSLYTWNTTSWDQYGLNALFNHSGFSYNPLNLDISLSTGMLIATSSGGNYPLTAQSAAYRCYDTAGIAYLVFPTSIFLYNSITPPGNYTISLYAYFYGNVYASSSSMQIVIAVRQGTVKGRGLKGRGLKFLSLCCITSF